MSDIRLFNAKDHEGFSKIKLNKINMQKTVEENLEELLGLTLVSSNYQVQSHPNEIIDTIAIDENFQIVVIEYREGKFGQTINKGIFHMDYIKNNLSEFKILITDKLGKEVGKNILYHPRLISIGDDFNRYDEYAISQLPLEIDLIKLQAFTKGMIILEKAFQGLKQNHFHFNYIFKNEEQKQLYNHISQFVLSLGDEVTESGFNGFLSFRRIKNFMYLIFKDEIVISLKLRGQYRTYQVKTIGDFNRLKANIESAYDQN